MLKGSIFPGILCGLILLITSVSALSDPFYPASMPKPALTRYPLTALTMVGTITKNDQLWAIIRAPDQRVYPATVGTPIGLADGHVMQVTAQQVTVQVKQDKNNMLNPPQVTTLWLTQVQ